MKSEGKRRSKCTQPSVPTRLLKGLRPIPLEGLSNHTTVCGFPLRMKQREPEARTEDESPEPLTGLSDLLSQATDSYPQQRKYTLT